MALLSRLSNVNIVLDTLSVKVKSFADMLIIGETNMTNRVTSVSSVTELDALGIASGTALYNAVRDALAQKNSLGGISNVYIGRKTPVVEGKENESWATALKECRLANKTPFGVVSTTTDALENMAMARFCESEGLLFGCASGDTQIKDATIKNDILSNLAAANLFNTFCVYDDYAAEQSIPAALMARKFAEQAGSENWTNVRLAGIKASALTEAEAQIIHDKHGITVESFNDDDFTITQNGVVVAKEWIQTIRGRAALKNELEVETARVFIDSRVKYNDSGIAAVVAAMIPVLDKYQRIGFIDENMVADKVIYAGYTITTPKAAEISANTRASGKLTGVGFKARLAGSINSVTIDGSISYATNTRG